jgi:putative ABC transport system permease protein
MDRAMKVEIASGASADLVGDTVLVEQGRASSAGITIGDTLTMEVFGEKKPFRVVGTFVSSPAIWSTLLTSLDGLEEAGVLPADAAVFVMREPGADAASVKAGLTKVVQDLPTVTLKDQAEFAAEQRAGIDQALTIIYAMLGLAIVIAILGIVNTLALSVIERTREVGLLRAVGLSRRQLRRMVRLESVIIALLGGALGIGLGLLFGVSFQQSQKNAGIEILSVPLGQLLVFAVLAVIVGVLASLWPARRAARLDVLRAITAE